MKKANDKSFKYQNYRRNLISATSVTNIGINNHDRLVKVYGPASNRIEVLIKLKQQSKFTLCWFVIFACLGFVCLFISPKNWFQVVDLFILMINIYLVAKGKLIGIYIGILECIFYAWICYQSALYGEIIKMMCISVPLNILSIVSWTRSIKKQKQEKFVDSNKKEEEIVIRKLTKKSLLFFSLGFIGCVGFAYCLLRFIVGQTNALILGSITLSITIIGKILTSRRYMESYILFIIGDIVCLFMWLQTMLQSGANLNDITMLVYYMAGISFNVYAYELWKSMYKKVAINGGVILAKRKVNIKKIIKLRHRYKNLHWDREVDIAKNS